MGPSRLVTRTYVGRGARIWLGTRALASGLFLFATVDPVRLPVGSIAQLVLVTVALCFLDVHRRRERALLGNLAVGSGTLALLFAVPAVCGEMLISLVAISVL